METIIRGTPKEIAALVVAVQERQGLGLNAESFAKVLYSFLQANNGTEQVVPGE